MERQAKEFERMNKENERLRLLKEKEDAKELERLLKEEAKEKERLMKE